MIHERRQRDAAQLCVLKFGSSVLSGEGDYHDAAQEIYRHIRDGEQIIAVVSACGDETDALLAQAARVSDNPAPGLIARLVRTGELKSAALMGLALCRIGARATVLDPHEMGLVAAGDPLDADLCALNAPSVLARFQNCDVIVVPGFVAGHDEHGIVTLGRGGTDLSAVFFAARLGSRRVRLLKDVDGVYAEDPRRNPRAERYGTLGYAAAAQASAGLIQPKAIEAAEAHGIAIEVAAIGHHEATVIAALPARKEVPVRFPRLRVALLGCGAVGAGVLDRLAARPDLFEINPIFVRNPERYAGRKGHLFTGRFEEAVAPEPDLLVELIGGADHPAELIHWALRRGVDVVSANKAAIARHYDALHASAGSSGARLAYSAAVGGGVAVLETIARLREHGGISCIEGVMNGTVNFLLGRLEEGWPLDAALERARALGFAEADASADLDGHDAAEKLAILARHAFGIGIDAHAISRQSLRNVSPADVRAALDRGLILKQIGRVAKARSGKVEASVRIEALTLDHMLGGASDEQNRFLMTDGLGRVHAVHGKGAGRWPTTAAVIADVMDIQRARASQDASCPPERRRA